MKKGGMFMALSNNAKGIIEAVAKNDIQKAKGYAKCLLADDKSAKNANFRNRMNNLLSKTGFNMLELPAKIQRNALFEDVCMTFNENRYYLSDRNKEIFEAIIRKKKICAAAESLGVSFHNTTLLYGPTGTGKTEFGRYISYKMGVPFLYMKFSECIDSYMGNTAKNVAAVFDFARENDCVLMIDEIDTIASNRDKSNNTGVDGEKNRVTITIMQEFDRLPSNAVVIAATNRLDLLDDALLNRFAIKEEFLLPDEAELNNIVTRFFGSLNRPIPSGLRIKKGMCQRDLHHYMLDCLISELEKEYIEVEDNRPHTKVKVEPDEYDNISNNIQNYIGVNKLDGISIGVTLDIQKKSYDNSHFTGRTLERTVKTIKQVGYTEYNVVAW